MRKLFNMFLVVSFALFLNCFLFNEIIVFAEENVIVDDYKILINDSEIYNYELENDTIVKINQVYDESLNCSYIPDKEIFIDYLNKLYGEYKYNFSLVCDEEIIDAKEISINYLGNNNDIINVNDIYFYDNTYYILNNSGVGLTVIDVINMFNDELDRYNAKLFITDMEANILLDSDLIQNNYKLKLEASYDEYGIINEISNEFNIKIVEDMNNDDFIDNLDIKILMLDEVLNGKTSILDVINIGNDNIVDASDYLTKDILVDSLFYVNEEFELKYYLDGFNMDILNGVMGNLKYDKELLELISIEINSNNSYGKFNEFDNFVYLLNDYNQNGLFLTFKFKAINEGDASISLNEFNLVTSGGSYANIDEPLFNVNVSIIENGKGGDSLGDEKEEINEEIPKEDEKFNNIVQPLKNDNSYTNTNVYEVLKPAKVIENVSLSSDNYIKSLKIKGYNIDFDRDVFEYSIKVGSDVNRLDLDIVLNDGDAYYTVIGNDKFKIGDNEVSIIVTSLDGSIKKYVINVKKENNSLEENIEKEKNNSKNVIILLIILIIIGLIYIIFKDDEDNI